MATIIDASKPCPHQVTVGSTVAHLNAEFKCGTPARRAHIPDDEVREIEKRDDVNMMLQYDRSVRLPDAKYGQQGAFVGACAGPLNKRQ